MLKRIMLYIFLAISPIIGLCESADNNKNEIAQQITYKGGFEIRIIAEKRQPVENGLRFDVELENKLSESVSFITKKKDIQRAGGFFKENDVPFSYTIQSSSQNPEDNTHLATFNDSNFVDMTSFSYNRRIYIDAGSTIQLGSVEFSEHFIPGEIKDGIQDLTIKTIGAGIFKIEASLSGFVITDPKLNVDEVEKNMTTIFTVISEPIVVVLE